MEQNEQNVETFVEDKGERQGAHSPSVDNLFSNRDVLARRLQHRSNREDLVLRGIIPASNTNLAAQITQLERAKTGDYLRKKIRARPSKQQLIQRHILADSKADASLQGRQAVLERQRIADHLNEQLFNRPGPIELIKDNILVTDPALAEAVKQGCIDFHSTKGDDLVYNAETDVGVDVFGALSPVSPNSTDQIDVFSKAFSDHVQVEAKLQEQQAQQENQQLQQQYKGFLLQSTQPCCVNPPYTKKPQFQQLQQQQQQLLQQQEQQQQYQRAQQQLLNEEMTITPSVEQHSQNHVGKQFVMKNNLQLQIQNKEKEAKKSPKVSRKKQAKPQPQPKFKKHKFHEYKPPDVQGPSDNIDDRYQRLLEQQTLFLQLQVQQQNAVMAALNDPSKEVVKSSEDSSELSRERSSSSLSTVSNTSSQGSNPLEEMRVTELRNELKSRGLPVSGPKAKLLERLKTYEDGKFLSDFSNQLKQTSTAPTCTPGVQVSSVGESTRNTDVNTSNKSNTVLQVTTYATANGQTFQVVQAVPNVSQNLQNVIQDQNIIDSTKIALSPYQMQQLNVQNVISPLGNTHVPQVVHKMIPVSQQQGVDMHLLQQLSPPSGVQVHFGPQQVDSNSYQHTSFSEARRQHSSPANLNAFASDDVRGNEHISGLISPPSMNRTPQTSSLSRTAGSNSIFIQANRQNIIGHGNKINIPTAAPNASWMTNTSLSQSVPGTRSEFMDSEGSSRRSKSDAADNTYLKLKSYPWANPPVQVPEKGNNGSSFVMFKMKPDAKKSKPQFSDRSNDQQTNRKNTTNNVYSSASRGSKNIDYRDLPLSNEDSVRGNSSINTRVISPVGIVMNNNHLVRENLVSEVPQLSSSDRHATVELCNGNVKNEMAEDDHEELLNILGELSELLNKPQVDSKNNTQHLLNHNTSYQPVVREGEVKAETLNSAHIDSKAKTTHLTPPVNLYGKVFNSLPDKINLVGAMVNASSMQEPNDNMTDGKKIIKCETAVAASPMQVDEDSMMDVDSLYAVPAHGNGDLDWLDLSFSPGSSPRVPSQLSPKQFSQYLHPSNRDQSMGQRSNTVNCGNNMPTAGVDHQRNQDLISSLFDISEPSHSMALACDLHEERWDLF